MSNRSYIGFSTNLNAVTESSSPTSENYPSAIGVFNTSLEDYVNIKTPFIRNSTTGTGTNTITINVPTYNPGDLLIAFLAVKGASGTFTNASWTLQDENNGYTPSMAVFSRTATSSEPASYTFNISVADSALGAIISVGNPLSTIFGTFGASQQDPILSVPDDATNKKLIIFFIANNNGETRTWDINDISEFSILTVNNNISMQLKAIYRLFSNTSLTYTTNQSGAGSNSYGLSVVVK